MDDYALKGNFPTQSPTQQPTPKPTMRPTREQKAPYERMLEGLKPLAKYAKKPEVIAPISGKKIIKYSILTF